MRRPAGALALVLSLAVSTLAACAPVPTPGSPAATTAHPAAAPPPARALVQADTVPSADAQRVLGTIPEPLTAGERAVPPLAALPAAAIAAQDSTHVRARADSDSAASDSTRSAIPTPAPTTPLGEQPGSMERVFSADSAAAGSAGGSAPASSAAGVATAGGAAAGGGTTAGAVGAGAGGVAAGATHGATTGGECFRIQVGTSSDRKRADALRQAAESQLEIAFQVVKSEAKYKVRSRDCFGRDAADHLKERAKSAGFSGVFAVKQGAK